MHPLRRVSYLWNRPAHIRFRRVRRLRFAPVLGIFGALVLLSCIVYFWPAAHTYAYAGDNCAPKLTLLPRLHTLAVSDGSTAQFASEAHLGGYPLLARSVCAKLTEPPNTGNTINASLQPFGTSLLKLPLLKLQLPKPPQLQNSAFPELISGKDPLQFTLQSHDRTFSYSLASESARAPCVVRELKLSCDTAALGLAQATMHKLRLVRSFGSAPVDVLLTGSVQTVTPIIMTGSSAPPGSVMYDAPSTLTITFDKPVASFEDATLTQAGGATISTTPRNEGNQIVLTLAQPLARQAAFELRIKDVRATDKGYLTAPIVIGFTTSGGPRVVSKNIGSAAVSPGAVIRLTFDSPLKPGEAAAFIQLVGIPASITSSGNVATISPHRNFGRCEAFSVRVADGLPNAYGVTGGSAYTFNSRALCRSTFSIGTSAEGRSITAYKFGSGPSVVLYVGATHGNERSSKYILDSWVQHLEGVAPNIPAHRSVIVIPNLNPDGFARGSRLNARGVDLNRNFPANNWKSDVTLPGGQMQHGGGGSTPLSEPESSALASYTQSVRPRLVLTYHSKASIVTANESGDSMALAIQYGRATGYRAVAESQLGGTFNYDTTGAYENWLHDRVGIPALLVELPGNTANYFSRNRAAMWAMVGL